MWIPIEDKLPEENVTVLLCHFRDGELIWMASGERDTTLEGTDWYCDFIDDDFNSEWYHTITHWRPMIDIPTNAQKGLKNE